ncbi:DUF2585 family protein [Acetobacteraceae bacterium]|nr:DUF2585 family protein [Candidatus Parcubacteria bacterium]
MGQPALCQCGYVKLWAGEVLSGENSQQFFDWYTFSHIAHGFIFYFLLSVAAPKLSVGVRLLIAIGIEMSWEILENTPMVINHYRQQALAQGYTGDSILNSVSDTLSMVFGFILSRKLPVAAVIVIAVAMEAFTLYMVRDGLILNVINLIHPFNFLETWQLSGTQ